MQTNFTLAQLADPALAEANSILRNCVHCGFCTATCPTYVALGDELDSPRGRIYLIKDLLENNKPATAEVAVHIDRCLSCLACMTACPSSVNYIHLIDQARVHVERTYARPWMDRLARWFLAKVLPHPTRFRTALIGARLLRPVAWALPAKLRAMIRLSPKALPAPSPWDAPQVFPAQGTKRMRVALLTGCAQRALNTDINEATIRLLTRHGVEVVIVKGAGCCGGLTHHMGKADDARQSAAATIRAWSQEMKANGLDAIVINTSGCGTTVKDYGHMFRDDPALGADAARISAMAKDISEVMTALGLRNATQATPLRIAYHAACSLQHGQQIKSAPQNLLRAAGFQVLEPANSHLCCGSAGTYNLLQPEISAQLRQWKADAIAALTPEVIASGNLGCMMQIGSATATPVVHTVELLDWATGGPPPPALR